jgi:hypothetical protein
MNAQSGLSLLDTECQWQESFLAIQSYQDEQVAPALTRLKQDHGLLAKLDDLLPETNTLLSELDTIDTVEALQSWIEKRILPVISKTYSRLSISGLDQLDPNRAYVFISNHRDIVMDPLLLNQALRQHGFGSANCAIGDNLLIHPSSNDLALLNRCFKVFRSLKSPRAMLNAMKTQSAYIQYLHFNRHEHVWIAQKEGRAKDNIDKTNPALIKMLGLSKPRDWQLSDYLESLNIVPVCFSYEWDPCDINKATELQAMDDGSGFLKTALDDLNATQKGIKEYKGNIHLHFCEPLRAEVETPFDHKVVADTIDRSIKQHYRIYPVNYAAFRKIKGQSFEPCPYTKQEVNAALKDLETRLEACGTEIKRRVMQAYAQALL